MKKHQGIKPSPRPRRLPTIVLAAGLLGILLSRCSVQAKWRSDTFFVFDTICEVTLYSSGEAFREARETIRKLFSDIDRVFSPGSEENSSEMARALFRRAYEIYVISEGCFDITVAPLSKIWGFWNGEYRVPSPEQIYHAVQSVGMDKIKEGKSTLHLSPGSGLDWGGIAKGLGIDQAARSLIDMGISRGFINAGGDLYCWGENPTRSPWKIGIKHPRLEGLLGVLDLSDSGAATAGDYQRFFVENGVRHHHIFDPRSGYPASGKQSVTVFGPETLICDALSTALFVSSKPGQILARYPGYGAIIMDSAGKISVFGKRAPFQPSQYRLK